MANGAKILIADDYPDVVRSTKFVLESAGHSVLTAGSPAEAWEQVTTNKPDLILLDIMMPDKTEGFQFIWRLRNEGPDEVRDTPIIVVSGIHGTTELRFYPESADGMYTTGEFLPVQGFIDKPLEPKALLAKIAELVGK